MFATTRSAKGTAVPSFSQRLADSLDEWHKPSVSNPATPIFNTSTQLSKLVAQELRQIHSAADLVSTFFQTTLQAERLSASVRLLFARLQTLIMREAINKPALFISQQHPALSLATYLVSCAAGFENLNATDAEVEQAIRNTVVFIEQCPEHDHDTFALAKQRFLDHFSAPPIPSDMPVNPYRAVIQAMLKNLPVRPEISNFLFNVWIEVLAVAAQRHGQNAPQTQALIQVVNALLWGSGARKSRRSRTRTIKEMPQLLEKVRSGMTLLGLAPEQQAMHIHDISTPMIDAFLSSRPQAAAKPRQLMPVDAQPKTMALAATVHENDMLSVEVIERHTNSMWHLFDAT